MTFSTLDIHKGDYDSETEMDDQQNDLDLTLTTSITGALPTTLVASNMADAPVVAEDWGVVIVQLTVTMTHTIFPYGAHNDYMIDWTIQLLNRCAPHCFT